MRSFRLRDHFARTVIRCGISGEENEHVDIELNGIAADLHVSLFENVEQADLNQFVEFGNFVHGKDAAMHAGNKAEMQGILGRHAGSHGQLGRVDFADDIGELGSRRQTLGVTLLTRPPGNTHLLFRCVQQEFSARLGNWPIGVFVNG